VTWLIHISHWWHVSFIYLISDMTHSYVPCVTWLSPIPSLWHDSFVYLICDMTHSYVCHDSFIRVPWLIYHVTYVSTTNYMCMYVSAESWHWCVCDMDVCVTWMCVWHGWVCDMDVCVTWMCVEWPIEMRCKSHSIRTRNMTRLELWHDSFLCVT